MVKTTLLVAAIATIAIVAAILLTKFSHYSPMMTLILTPLYIAFCGILLYYLFSKTNKPTK